MAHIHPSLRAALDRELEEAAQLVLARAAEHDGKDLIEANVDLMNEILADGLSHSAALAAAAMLALRLHRSGGGHG